MATTTKKKKSTTLAVSKLPPTPVLAVCYAFTAQGREEEAARRFNLTVAKVKAHAKAAQALSAKACFFCGTAQKKAKKGEAASLCGCLHKHTRGYREHLDWKNVKAFVASVDSGEISRDAVAYSDDCVEKGCGRRFAITAGQVAKAFRTYKTYSRAWKCQACKQAADAAKKAAALAAAVSEKSEKPAKAKKAKTGLATIGDQIAAKKAAGGEE